MPRPRSDPMRFHEDAVLFREAVGFTAAETGFSPRLIEKDYFCSLLLGHLAQAGKTAVFKGGTCLSKVHSSFYRLSEDLDFSISMDPGSTRAERSRAVAPFRRAAESVPSPFSWRAPLRGANQSRQYIGIVAYRSITTGLDEAMKVETGLREPILRGAVSLEARTLLLNPVTNTAFAPNIPVPCMTKEEALAEKCRAALTRREIAIRDFFDIDHFVRTGGLDPDDPECLVLVRRKITMQGNEPVRLGDEVREELSANARLN